MAKVTSKGNHVMLYIGEGMVAHTNGDLITYKKPFVSGFKISKLEDYYLTSTKINVMRVKDEIVSEDYVVNSKITWPDTGKEEYILGKTMNIIIKEIFEFEAVQFSYNSIKSNLIDFKKVFEGFLIK